MTRRVACAIAAAVSAVACSPHDVTERPKPPVEIPKAFTERALAGDRLPDKWWREFGDTDLDGLVGDMLRGNFELKGAWARLDQARTMARQAGAGRFPQLDADFTARRTESRNPFIDADEFEGMVGPETFTANQFIGSLAASYEVDVWKKNFNQAKSGWAGAEAARADLEAMTMSMAAQVAETWYSLALEQATRKLVREQQQTNEQFLELTELRFQQGLASALDIYQQKRLVIERRAQLEEIEGQITALRNQLAVLTGKTPNAIGTLQRDTLPKLPPVPGIGVPADLLVRRPDVRAAAQRVLAADYQVAVAVADRLPAIRLSGTLTLQNGKLSELISRPLWSLIGNVLAPLIDGGRRAAEVDRQRAIVRERLAGYGQALIVAMSEVDTALAQELAQAKRIEQLREEAEVAGFQLREARNRYREGLSDFLPVLNALQTEQIVQLTLLAAERQRISFRIQLYRALGGTWTTKLDEPKEDA